jgi:hypothetical protein
MIASHHWESERGSSAVVENIAHEAVGIIGMRLPTDRPNDKW